MSSLSHPVTGVEIDQSSTPSLDTFLLHGTQLRRSTHDGLTIALYELPSDGAIGGVAAIRSAAYRDYAEQHNQFPNSDGPGTPIGFGDHAVGLWFPSRNGVETTIDEAWADLKTLAESNREFEDRVRDEFPEVKIDEEYPVFGQTAALQGDRLFTIEDENIRAGVWDHPRRENWYALLDKRTHRFEDYDDIQKTIDTGFCDYTDSIGRWTEICYTDPEEALVREHLRQLIYVVANSRQTIDARDRHREERELTEAPYAYP